MITSILYICIATLVYSTEVVVDQKGVATNKRKKRLRSVTQPADMIVEMRLTLENIPLALHEDCVANVLVNDDAEHCAGAIRSVLRSILMSDDGKVNDVLIKHVRADHNDLIVDSELASSYHRQGVIQPSSDPSSPDMLELRSAAVELFDTAWFSAIQPHFLRNLAKLNDYSMNTFDRTKLHAKPTGVFSRASAQEATNVLYSSIKYFNGCVTPYTI